MPAVWEMYGYTLCRDVLQRVSTCASLQKVTRRDVLQHVSTYGESLS
ncbi:MAG: hypothetical protein II859_06020 [Bacteroidales bacterium]|nr:hypothetical protein [Bacteroidales bacterium]